jgi:multiple sugar transport system substrate-binding protein
MRILMKSFTSGKKLRVSLIAGLVSLSLATFGIQNANAVTELRFAALAGIDNNFKPVIEQWNKENPDIQIKVETLPPGIPEIVKNLAASSLAGNAPDIINNLDTYADQLADVGFTEDLTKYFGTGPGALKRTNFNQAFLSSYVPINFPKQVHGLPIAADAIVVFYNKTLFKKAGVTAPKDGWTYDQYLKACDAMSKWGAKQKPQVWGSSGGPGGGSKSIWQAQYNPFLHAVGAYTYDRNTNTSKIAAPEAIGAWKELVKPWQSGCIPKYSISSGKTPPTFQGGQVAMETSVRALLPTYKAGLAEKKMEWDVVDMPTIKGKVSKYIIGGGSYGLGMAATSKNKAAAWKFIDWFYTTKNGGINTLQAGGSLVPPTDAGIANGDWRKLAAPPANINAFSRAIKNSFIAPKLPGQAGTVLDTVIADALAEILLKNVSVEAAFKKAEAKVTAAIKKELAQ